MTPFDVMVLTTLIISGGLGYVRGATREIVTALSLVLGVVIAVLSLRFLGPIARKLIDPDWAALTVALIIAFILAYLGLRLAGSYLAKRVRAAKHLGRADHWGGVAIGLVRAGVLLGCFNLLLVLATPTDRMPRWITHAAFYPFTKACADLLRLAAPGGKAVAGKVGPSLERAVREGGGEPAAEAKPPGKSKDNERSRQSPNP